MDIISVLASTGPFALLLVGLVVFVENGLLFPFLPGDSLVFAAAVVAGAIGVPWPVVIAVVTVAAVAGGEVGFSIGRKYGRGLFRPGAKIFRPEYLTRTEAFFARWGSGAIVLARFVPIVRTFITVMAGVGTMGFRRFVAYSGIGGVVWAAGVTVLGYFLGQVAFVRDHIEAMLMVIVGISVIPILVEFLRARAARKVRRHLAEDES
jgi:membrane-associated protein